MDDDISALHDRVKDLENLVLAQGHFMQEFAVSVFRSYKVGLEDYDAATDRIRENYGVVDASAPGAIKAAARVQEVRPYLEQILAAVRTRLVATPKLGD